MVYAHDNGKYGPCNFAVPDEHMGVDNTSITEWMQSDKMNQLRSEMLDPNSDHKLVNQVCQKCKFDEERYDWSRRLDTTTQAKRNKDYWDIITRCVELSKAAGYYDFDERILELQLRVFGSKCNLDCYMCHHFRAIHTVLAPSPERRVGDLMPLPLFPRRLVRCRCSHRDSLLAVALIFFLRLARDSRLLRLRRLWPLRLLRPRFHFFIDGR